MSAKASPSHPARDRVTRSPEIDIPPLQQHAVESYAHDVKWETTLLTMLSELEQQTLTMTAKEFQSDPCRVVHQIGAALRFLDEYTAGYAKSNLLIADRLAEARNRAEQFEKARAELPTSLPKRNVLGFTLRRDPQGIRHQESCRRLVGESPPLFECYLMALANGFTTGQCAAKWIETVSVFLRQANKHVKLTLDTR